MVILGHRLLTSGAFPFFSRGLEVTSVDWGDTPWETTPRLGLAVMLGLELRLGLPLG
jgi:hypothetical protein